MEAARKRAGEIWQLLAAVAKNCPNLRERTAIRQSPIRFYQADDARARQ